MQNFCSSITGRFIKMLLVFPVALIAAVQMTSCEAIFEKNISKDSLTLIIPVNNDTAVTNNVQFKWEELKGATHYKLQIVKASFSNINSFLLDSNIVGEEFYFALSPGSYQFQIRGENSAYETPWVGPYNLVVDSVSDLTGQVVPLIAPVDLLYSNDANFTFSWQPVYAAETYEFQLRAGADFTLSGTTLHSAPGIYGTAYSTPTGLFDTEGAYAWGVKAVNQTSYSDFSDRTLYIDLTAPNSPLSVAPAHGVSFADTVVFEWNMGTDPGLVHAPVSRIFQISSDTTFSSILQSYTLSTDTFQYVFTSSGTYWWRVYALDQAGNISTNYSAHRKVIIP